VAKVLIWEGIKNYKKQYHLGHWKKEDKCLDCEYLPLCFGGCRYAQLQRHGEMSKIDCMKNYFDSSLETMLSQDIEYRY
jgi:uncharacterized protein